MPLPKFAIEATGLKKLYRSQNADKDKLALKGIDLSIPRGSLFGLLGPNGAGKSTFINILAGLTLKTDGIVKIWDKNIEQDPRNCRASIGVVPQELNVDAFFTPKEMLNAQAGLYGVPKAERITNELLERMGLTEKANAYSRALSGGMKRRLMVAKAMVHRPPILVLDEPTAGVDIELRQNLWEYVKELNRSGVTVLLTTHYLEEAEELCDQIGIINHGELVACEKKESLIKKLDRKTLYFTLSSALTKIPDSLKKYAPKLVDANQISLSYTPSKVLFNQILNAVNDAGIEIKDLRTEESDLEDAFLQLTRRKTT